MNTDKNGLNAMTETIIGCAFKVGNKLGCGFLEKCYENALAYELRKATLRVEQQILLQVRYEDIVVGDYVADLIVEQRTLVEIKAVSRLDAIHAAQCINYLTATHLPVCLLINFGSRVEVKRIAGPGLRSSPASVSICAPSVAKPSDSTI